MEHKVVENPKGYRSLVSIIISLLQNVFYLLGYLLLWSRAWGRSLVSQLVDVGT